MSVERLIFVERFATVKRMEVTVSDKYQVVIPKEARLKLGLKPGQKVRVKSIGANTITFERPLSPEQYVRKYAGSMVNTPWRKEGIDAAEWIRRQRDSEWI